MEDDVTEGLLALNYSLGSTVARIEDVPIKDIFWFFPLITVFPVIWLSVLITIISFLVTIWLLFFTS